MNCLLNIYASQGTYVPSAHLEGGVPAATDYAVNQGMYHKLKHIITDFRNFGVTEIENLLSLTEQTYRGICLFYLMKKQEQNLMTSYIPLSPN